jgi:hypothetical protein
MPSTRAVSVLAGALRATGGRGWTSLTHVVLTHLDPKSIPTLEALLSRLPPSGGSKPVPVLVLSNPALRLLQTTLGGLHGAPAGCWAS